MVNIQKNNHLSTINNHLAFPNRLSSPHSQKVLVVPSITLFRSLSAVALAKADAFCAFLRLTNPRKLRNPWLINDLRAYNVLYNCRETFTDVMSALQIRLFMQNKANFRKSQMNVNKVLTKDYEKRTLGQRGKTKPIKANQSQLKPIKCQNKPNTNPNKPNLPAPKPCRFGRAVVN